MSETGIRERVTNVLLLLYLVDQANAKGKVEDEFKLQKMVFRAQKKLVEKKLKAFSYNFFRWLKGPFSKNLRIDFITLRDHKFLKVTRDGIELSSKGKELVEDSKDVFDTNRMFLRYVDQTIERYAKLSPEDIKEEIYSLKVMVPRIRELMTIKEIPLRQLILFKTSDKKARAIFRMPSSWLATFEIMFDEEAVASLERALDDAIEGRAKELPL